MKILSATGLRPCLVELDRAEFHTAALQGPPTLHEPTRNPGTLEPCVMLDEPFRTRPHDLFQAFRRSFRPRRFTYWVQFGRYIPGTPFLSPGPYFVSRGWGRSGWLQPPREGSATAQL